MSNKKHTSVESAIHQMQESLLHLSNQHKKDNWFNEGRNKLSLILSGDKDIAVLGKELILFLSALKAKLKLFEGS